MKIGITIGINNYGESIWINGMKLNGIIFAELLKKSKKKYDIYLLISTNVKIDEKMAWDLKEFPTYYYKDKLHEMDFLILLGGQLPEVHMKKFKDDGKKIVFYKCGNSYIVHAEEVMFHEPHRTEKFTKQVETYLDEIWYVPQQGECCHSFFQCMFRTKTRPIPFVYHQRWIESSAKGIEHMYKKGAYRKPSRYVPSSEKKKLTIMEPNLNIVKYSMIPLMIAETSYRGDIGKNNI